ncbi:hypothetical protein N7527_009043 [Penicillium freii]|nr:hypothetical protein N7527_009043 [Penicillium freii]
MRLEGISENSKRIISAMRNLIDRGETKHLKEDLSGWQYGGETFIEMVASLEKGIKQELESQNIHVVGCSVRHFSKGANIKPSDSTKQLLIIPINGISTLIRSGQLPTELPTDTFCYIDDRPTLSGDNIDVIFVAFETNKDVDV